jgi:hypothetical protein
MKNTNNGVKNPLSLKTGSDLGWNLYCSRLQDFPQSDSLVQVNEVSKRAGIANETVPKLSRKVVVTNLDSLGSGGSLSLADLLTQEVNNSAAMTLVRRRMNGIR